VTFDLDRFKRAQEGPGGFATALRELEAGAKHSHWIWYIFPQLAGLGRSPAAQMYGVHGADEAAAYLRDPLLRDRLLTVTRAALAHLQLEPPVALSRLMGSEIDALKFVSSMTLFRDIARRLDDGEVVGAAEGILQAARLQGMRECAFTLAELDSPRPS
jgi:uncharacterized protein (DUF1810 family)